jgi:ATP-dependent Zn protease
MTNLSPDEARQQRLGAAYHEAGHAVVASALGLRVTRIEVAVGGDDAKGATDIEDDSEQQLVNRIAICAAGLEAQKFFEAPTHDLAALGDYGKMATLLEDFDEAASFAIRNAGHQRACELLKLHSDKVERTVQALMAHLRIENDAVCELLR